MRARGFLALLLLACTVAAGGAADEAAPAAADPAGAEASDPEGAEPPPSRTELRVGWDAGPTYGVVQRFPTLRAYDPTGVVQDVRLEGRIGGSLYLDGGLLGGSATSNGWEAAVRRLRLATSGRFDYGFRTEYKVEFALESTSFYLNDFYLRWRPGRFGVDTIRIGYFDPPMSLEALASSSDRSLPEVAPPVAAFAPGLRSGIEIAGAFERADVAWAVSLASVGQTQPFGDASTGTARGGLRLVWRPWNVSGGDAPTVLHLGASTGFTVTGSGELRWRSRPETFLEDYAVDTQEVGGTAVAVGGEVGWRRGPLTVIAEALGSFVSPDDGPSRDIQGAYVQASWALTGETRPYDAAVGVFRRLVPRAPFAPWRDGGGWGALELTGRASWLDLTDGDLRGGRMASFSLGPAWTANEWVRVLAAYVFARTSARADPGAYHVGQMRLELRF